MLRFKASTCTFTAQGLHLRQKTQIDCKKVSKWPAGSPESPDFMRRLPTNCGRRDVQSCSCLRSSLVEPKDLHGLKSKRQVVLVQAVRKQGVMIFQSWQCSFQQKWQILVQKVKNLPVCLHSVSSFTCQWSRSTWVPSCCLESPLLGGARSSTCLQSAVAKDQSTAACWQHISFCCVLASKSTSRCRLLIPLADHFTTHPTGRPFHHSSRWPTTPPLVPLADHSTTRPTGRPLHHLAPSRLPCNF
nr:uncharacterized protein LOC125990374 isoform X1 [Syngnathus scovelli]